MRCAINLPLKLFFPIVSSNNSWWKIQCHKVEKAKSFLLLFVKFCLFSISFIWIYANLIHQKRILFLDILRNILLLTLILALLLFTLKIIVASTFSLFEYDFIGWSTFHRENPLACCILCVTVFYVHCCVAKISKLILS